MVPTYLNISRGASRCVETHVGETAVGERPNESKKAERRMQGIEHLRAQARKEQMQGMQGIEHL